MTEWLDEWQRELVSSLKSLAAYAAGLIVLYLGIAFVTLEPDLTQWSEVQRLAMCWLALLAIPLRLMAAASK